MSKIQNGSLSSHTAYCNQISSQIHTQTQTHTPPSLAAVSHFGNHLHSARLTPPSLRSITTTTAAGLTSFSIPNNRRCRRILDSGSRAWPPPHLAAHHTVEQPTFSSSTRRHDYWIPLAAHPHAFSANIRKAPLQRYTPSCFHLRQTFNDRSVHPALDPRFHIVLAATRVARLHPSCPPTTAPSPPQIQATATSACSPCSPARHPPPSSLQIMPMHALPH